MKRPPGGAGTVVVFAKAPRPGRVKTRMCPPLSGAQAAALYSAMLADVLEATAAFAAARDALLELLEHQWPVVEGRRQPKAEVDQVQLA